MALLRSRAPTNIGSAPWILKERNEIQLLVNQDSEAFALAARNEAEWLNDHMAKVFGRNEINLADMLKTPSRLRGKTPATAWKRNGLEARVPLAEVFSANQRVFQSPSPHKQPYKQAAHFEVAEDPFVEAPAASKKPEKPAQAGIANTDSGYHGISGDEMDTEPATQTSEIEPLKSHSPGLTRNNMDENVRNGTSGLSPDYRSTAKSFRYGHGALSGKIDRLKLQLHGNTATKVGQDGETSTPLQPASTLDQSTSATLPDTVEKKTGIISHPDKESMLDDTRTIDDVRSASEGSSPVRALVRKSSLTFAALPARAPLAIKKSIDARHSRTSHLEQFAMAATSRGSYFDSHTEGKSLGGLQPRQRAEEANDDEEMNDNEEGLDLRQTNAPVVDVTMTELHHKSSTQRLHEKINKLGRSNSVVNHGSSPKQSTTPVGSPRRTQKEDQVIASPFITEANTGDVEMADAAPVMAPPPSRNQRQISQTQKTREFCRPVKPSREVAAKPKPKPVAIRVGTLSQRVPLSNATLSSTLQESLPPSIPKQPMAPRKDLPQPTQGSSSNTGFKSSVSSTISKPKGLLAAERKKLQNEREAQRKLDQRREMERKRAAQQVEARKRERDRSAESERGRTTERGRARERAPVTEAPKKTAQQLAIERRRMENARRAEQQRNVPRPGTGLARVLEQEDPEITAAPHRGELGNLRLPSWLNPVQDFGRPGTAHPLPNAAKSAKRPAEEEPGNRPGINHAGTVSQDNDTKRRKSDEVAMQEAPIRLIQEPDGQAKTKKHFDFAAISAQTAKLKARINEAKARMESNRQRDPETLRPRDPPEPFNDARVTVALAEITNPPATGPRTSLHSSNSGSAGTWSNEERSESNDIELPEIDTDEEDGGSAKPGKKVFVPPDWANTPELRQALEDQMCVDHEEIFGPIQPVDLAKMFKDKRLRRRGSSGNWERDCLTEVEIEQDRLAREKIREDGAWSYEAIQDLHKGDERAFGR